jgi:uncharacterized protein (UPF0335 family)
MNDGIISDRLRLYVERIEALESEKKSIADDIKDVFSEAKAVGYDVPIIRHWIKERRIDKAKRIERDMLIETYGIQLGMFD